MNDWRVGGTSTHWAVKWFNCKDLAFFTIARHYQSFVSQLFQYITVCDQIVVSGLLGNQLTRLAARRRCCSCGWAPPARQCPPL